MPFQVPATGLQLRTLVTEAQTVELSLQDVAVPEPGPDQVIIRVEASPINPSDLGLKAQAFINLWFGGSAPAGLQIGCYSGAGVGLSTGGDAVNLFDGSGTLRAAVSFGASPSGTPLPSFDNSAGLNSALISSLSAIGVNGAFAAVGDANEIGSPGSVEARLWAFGLFAIAIM